MQVPLPTAELVDRGPDRRPLRFELALVIVVSLAVLAPGIWSYSLVDPWETHYGEVARTMLQDDDFVQTKWNGTSSGSPGDLEGFRSKPVLMFWMMATGLRAMGVAEHGGYSGEMTESVRVMIGIRLPFILSAIAGLTLLWWMLSRLVSRRLAWLSLLVVGTTPMFCMIARNAIPDMPMVACTMGAIALLILAFEDGDRPITPRGALFRGRLHYDARHIVVGICGGFVLLQAIYYAVYFAGGPQLGVRGAIPNPAVWLPLGMLLMLAALSHDGWLIFRLPTVLLGGVIAAIVNEPMPQRRPGQSLWRHVFDDILTPWDRHAVDRYLIRGISMLFTMNWEATAGVADRILAIDPLTTMRQLYMLGAYFLIGISLLAKGPPGATVVALVAFVHLIAFNRWRAFYQGAYELKRGIVLALVVALPWHIGMYLKEGLRFVDEYFYTHILNRAGTGVDNSVGTFEYYANQIGHGMWLWAALLPAALAATVLRSDRETRAGRVRLTLGLWAILSTALFCLVTTKFHHYILPAIPPLGLLVAWFLDDIIAKRERLHPLYAALGAGIVLLITRDMMYEPDRWIEMMVFRYDRPWPVADPYAIDTSDAFLGLGLFAAIALAVCATRFRRVGVGLVCTAGLAICVWALQVYMPIAGTHWGMRTALRAYYEQRTIYGEKLVYFGDDQFADAWSDAGDVHRFDTFIPDTLHVGQPLTIAIVIYKPNDDKVIDQEVALVGTATKLGGHTVELTLNQGERARLQPLFERAKKHAAEREVAKKRLAELEDKLEQAEGGQRAGLQKQVDEARRKVAELGGSAKKPILAVDADRLIAWQLYWRGENFWSGGEIWPWLPEMKTSFVNPNNVEFQKYLNDRTRAPLGRRYFVVTEAGRITTVRSLLPTPRARESFDVLDTTSNKFSLAAFEL
jgi:4-amino-4-deoxy-L-arabinose transferase-like glycosyltransferase